MSKSTPQSRGRIALFSPEYYAACTLGGIIGPSMPPSLTE
jgi:hypothetical protein